MNADAQNLKAQLMVLESRIRELRTQRASVTYTLEQVLAEAESLKRRVQALERGGK